MSRPAQLPVRVAYLVNQYPKVSHSFIRREIQALEASGIEVDRYAVRGWSDAVADPRDEAERGRTRYLLQGGAWGLLLGMSRCLFASPVAFAGALVEAVRLSRGAERSLAYHLVYLAEASVLSAGLRERGVKHLHAHFGTNSAAVALLAGRLTGVGYSFTVHGPEEFDKPAAISLGRKIQASRFVVAISSYGRSQLYRWIDPLHWRKVHVVHCGLEDSFHTGACATKGGPDGTSSLRLVCVGRLCEQKGQVLLIDALAALRERGLRPTLVLAGDGEMRQAIEARARALGVSDQLRITGWIGSDQVRDELLAARACVLPSFAEGLPVVIMEAMALARPVISTYVAGIPELVQPGKTGWLVPPGDVGALVDAMADCLSQPGTHLEEMGRAGRERVLERHDINVEAGKLATLFSACLAQDAARENGSGSREARL